MMGIKANQLPALAQTSANILMPRRELTGVTMGQLARTIKFRRCSLRARAPAWAVQFFEQLLPENRSPCYAGAMKPPIDNARARRRNPAVVGAPKYITRMGSNQGIRKKEKIALGGRRNPLKRLVSDKEIQENQSLFL
jgi:hypothetical protein